MSATEFDNFEAFWQRYREIHSDPAVRRAHAVATASAIAVIATSVATRRWLLLPLAPAVDFAIAQASHRRDGKRTRPWTHPLWHLRAELRLFRRTLRNWPR